MTDNGVPPQIPFDPQNSFGAQNPYGAPVPGPAHYDVPETWRSRFDFFSRYGHPSSSPQSVAAFKQLSFGQRMRLGANGPAFFFGPIYFAIKGPWRKGLTLLAGTFVFGMILSLIEYVLNFSFPPTAYSVAIGLIYSSTANWAYFLHVAHGSTSWNPFEGMPLTRRKS